QERNMSHQSPAIRGAGSRSFAGRTLRVTTATMAAVAMSVSVTPAAPAQSPGPSWPDPGSLVPSVAPGSLYGAPSLSIAGSTLLGAPIPLTAMLGSLAAVGSTEFDSPGGSSGAAATPVAERDLTINASTVRDIKPLWPESTA